MTKLQQILTYTEYSVSRIAADCGVDRSTVYLWRTGARYPSRASADRLLALFPNLSRDDLYPLRRRGN